MSILFVKLCVCKLLKRTKILSVYCLNVYFMALVFFLLKVINNCVRVCFVFLHLFLLLILKSNIQNEHYHISYTSYLSVKKRMSCNPGRF